MTRHLSAVPGPSWPGPIQFIETPSDRTGCPCIWIRHPDGSPHVPSPDPKCRYHGRGIPAA